MELFSRTIALLLILLLLPIFIFVIITLFLFQGLPIFYKQDRVGHNYSIFKIYKFRTMVNNSGDVITLQNDSRITFLGKFLRKIKVDEIPQLFNILKGEMRFIGPRPEVLSFFEKDKFTFLKKIKPGISDYSSILFRNEDQILKKIGGNNPYNILLPIKLSLAHFYTKKKSFMLDFKLVIVTILSIFVYNFTSKRLLLPYLKNNIPTLDNFVKKYKL